MGSKGRKNVKKSSTLYQLASITSPTLSANSAIISPS